jgi:hypothetical protein
VLLLSATAAAQGSGTIDLTIPQGQSSASFYVQGVDDQRGTPTIQATAPGYADGTTTAPVVAPAIDLSGLNTTLADGAPDDPFTVRIGIANANAQFLTELQDRRGGAQPLAVTVTSANPNVGQVRTSTASSGSVTVNIAAGVAQSPTTVAAGGVAFDPISAGSTTVTASIPGFTTTNPNGVVSVTVTTTTVLREAALRAVAMR